MKKLLFLTWIFLATDLLDSCGLTPASSLLGNRLTAAERTGLNTSFPRVKDLTWIAIPITTTYQQDSNGVDFHLPAPYNILSFAVHLKGQDWEKFKTGIPGSICLILEEGHVDSDESARLMELDASLGYTANKETDPVKKHALEFLGRVVRRIIYSRAVVAPAKNFLPHAS